MIDPSIQMFGTHRGARTTRSLTSSATAELALSRKRRGETNGIVERQTKGLVSFLDCKDKAGVSVSCTLNWLTNN